MPCELTTVVELRTVPGEDGVPEIIQARYFCEACKATTGWQLVPAPNPIAYRNNPERRHRVIHNCRESAPSYDPEKAVRLARPAVDACAESLIAHAGDSLRRALEKSVGDELQAGLREVLGSLLPLGKLAAHETIRNI